MRVWVLLYTRDDNRSDAIKMKLVALIMRQAFYERSVASV
jgi:hypothetical protein